MANSIQDTQQYRSATSLLQNILYPNDTSKFSNQVTTLAERIAAIPSKTQTFVKMDATVALSGFLTRELQHYIFIRDTENQAVDTIAAFIGAQPSDVRNKVVIPNTELSKQIQEVQGLMNKMRQNLDCTAYQLENKQGKTGFFAWMTRSSSCTYFYTALAKLEADQKAKTPSEPNAIIHVSSSATPAAQPTTATTAESLPASASSTSAETPKSSQEPKTAQTVAANSKQETAASADLPPTLSTQASDSPKASDGDEEPSPRSLSPSPRASSSSSKEVDSSQELPTDAAVATKSAPPSPKAEVPATAASTHSAPPSRRVSLNNAEEPASSGKRAKLQASPPTAATSATDTQSAPPAAASSQKATRANAGPEKKNRAGAKQL
jgi:hypothetical protein